MLFPNEGWEAGICPEFGGWVHTGTYVLCPRDTHPRTGLYALRGATAAGAARWGRVTYTITDPVKLAALAGREITFKAWTWSNLILGGSEAGNHREIEIGDNVGSTITAIPTTPSATWQQIEAKYTIGANPTSIFFRIYYYKGGYRAIWEINVDDMESDPVSAIVAPAVTTNPATSVAANSAVLNGTLDDDGDEACDCGFEWGETPAYGNTTPTQSRTTGQTFAQTITGLDPKKTYHFRALATNSAGTGYGANRTFTTLAVAPTVATNPAIDINNDSATLKGELTYDGGEACNCGFEYGETDAYGTTTPTQSKVTGEAFSQPITGLDANKTYHFRAIATNSAGTSHGVDRTFMTLVSAPAVTTNPATGLGAVLATINGTLDNDIGEACECGFEWGLDTGYGTITPTESKTTGETFSQVIGGLVPNTVYHFRAFATNSFGTGYGADRSFTTALVISRAFALAREEL